MNIPAIGQIITVNFDVEKELEDGTIILVDAGEELEVVGYDPCMTTGTTPEAYVAELATLELQVDMGDVMVQDMWDRSGCSDYYVSGEKTYISVDVDSDLKIIR